MVDLGQKGVCFGRRLFIINAKNPFALQSERVFLYSKTHLDYFSNAYLLATSVQLITLKNASI